MAGIVTGAPFCRTPTPLQALCPNPNPNPSLAIISLVLILALGRQKRRLREKWLVQSHQLVRDRALVRLVTYCSSPGKKASHSGLKHVCEKVGSAWVAMEKLFPTSPVLGGMEKDTGGQFPPKIIRPHITF